MDIQEYTGWRKWQPTDSELSEFFVTKKIPFELLENEYLIIQDPVTLNSFYYCNEHGKLRRLHGSSIKTFEDKTTNDDLVEPTAKKKKYSRGKKTEIFPRNDEQVCAFDLVKDSAKTIKVLSGKWGTGKTMILVNAALDALRLGLFEQIVWIRNNVDVKDTKDLGALPGDTIDKLLPFLGPFIDHAGEPAVRTMLAKESLRVEPLQSLRGRNFSNTLIMCSEAENLTKEHLQLIIARAADGSQVWIDGDNRQRDRASFEKSRGIETLIDRLKGNELFGYVHLTKSERSATAALADLLD